MAHFLNFWDRHFFKKKSGPATLSFKRNNELIPRKLPDKKTEGQKDGRTDGKTLIHRTLPATTEGPKETNNNDDSSYNHDSNKKNNINNNSNKNNNDNNNNNNNSYINNTDIMNIGSYTSTANDNNIVELQSSIT